VKRASSEVVADLSKDTVQVGNAFGDIEKGYSNTSQSEHMGRLRNSQLNLRRSQQKLNRERGTIFSFRDMKKIDRCLRSKNSSKQSNKESKRADTFMNGHISKTYH
jgi:hypothetical protein